ncbi:hypothetical protein MRX96_057722 [Rhipicephalus microplus]
MTLGPATLVGASTAYCYVTGGGCDGIVVTVGLRSCGMFGRGRTISRRTGAVFARGSPGRLGSVDSPSPSAPSCDHSFVVVPSLEMFISSTASLLTTSVTLLLSSCVCSASEESFFINDVSSALRFVDFT